MACPLVSSELLNYRTPVLLRIMGVIKGRLHRVFLTLVRRGLGFILCKSAKISSIRFIRVPLSEQRGVFRISNAHIQSGLITNPTERVFRH